MKKFNHIIFERLTLQAEEAHEQGLLKLAGGLTEALAAGPEDVEKEYSSSEMEEDVYKNLWVAASNVIKYHNINNVDVEKLDEFIEDLTRVVVANVEEALSVEGNVGPREPKLPGESK